MNVDPNKDEPNLPAHNQALLDAYDQLSPELQDAAYAILIDPRKLRRAAGLVVLGIISLTSPHA